MNVAVDPDLAAAFTRLLERLFELTRDDQRALRSKVRVSEHQAIALYGTSASPPGHPPRVLHR
jgi:hypothetical protein